MRTTGSQVGGGRIRRMRGHPRFVVVAGERLGCCTIVLHTGLLTLKASTTGNLPPRSGVRASERVLDRLVPHVIARGSHRSIESRCWLRLPTGCRRGAANATPRPASAGSASPGFAALLCCTLDKLLGGHLPARSERASACRDRSGDDRRVRIDLTGCDREGTVVGRVGEFWDAVRAHAPGECALLPYQLRLLLGGHRASAGVEVAAGAVCRLEDR